MKEKKQITIPHILGQFVLEARNCEKPRRPSPYNKEQWSIEIMEGVFVGFDGFSFDENDKEDPNEESYLVTISLDDENRVSFIAALEECLSGEPRAIDAYIEALYERDVEDQLADTNTSYNREKFERLVRRLYSKKR